MGIAPFCSTTPDTAWVTTSRRSVVGSTKTRQTPATQESPAPQGLPQRPQCAAAPRRSTSQPFAGSPSQSPKPSSQRAMPQRPAAHTPVARAGAQARPQAPQWAAAVLRSTSQPVVALPSQSPRPAGQRSPQRPAVQVATPFGPDAQANPQAPQCATSEAVSRSQPLTALPSQSRNAPSQEATAQRPPVQVAVARLKAQRAPHAPQCATSVAGSTSQPLAASPSQSAAPASQRMPHTAPVQVAAARGPAAQARPQPPQCAVAPRVSTSQPLAASPSQSPRPGSQRITAQRPSRHTPSPDGGAQREPQAPQCAVEAVMSTQAPSQQVSPAPQGRAPSQAGRQRPSRQRVPGAHWLSARQATQRCAGTSQRGVMGVAAQPSSRLQPGTQRRSVGSQC